MTVINKWIGYLMCSVIIGCPLFATEYADLLSRSFSLGNPDNSIKSHYTIISEVSNLSPDQTSATSETYCCKLDYSPPQSGEKEGTYMCCSYSIIDKEGARHDIHSLKNWSHRFSETGVDKDGQVFGILHNMFENLNDAQENPLSITNRYMVYNTFIDFHSFVNSFGRKTKEGKGIQDLKKIGDSVIHEASFSIVPVHLGNQILKGSFFKNGKITLEFKGLTQLNTSMCALISFDSGKSNFKMLMSPDPSFLLETDGTSHYQGELYVDTESGVVEKVTMHEWVVSVTRLPSPNGDQISIIERTLTINSED